MKRLCSSALMIVLFLGNMAAQNRNTCGMDRQMLDQVTERLDENLRHLHEAADRGGATQYVPVRMILVAKDDGTGRVKERSVFQLLCALNEHYAPVGFRFYIENGEFRYVNHSGLYESQTGTAISVMKQNRSTKAINFFLTNTCDFGNNPGGNLEVLGYYQPSNDWLVIKRSEVNALSSTAPHEAGHFFSLLHPFNGWDQTPWVAGSTDCAPTWSPDIPNLKTEKADGSNSSNAGDKVTDTPASFNFVLDQADCGGVAYNGGARDVDCQPLKGVTQADNFMDYFSNCPSYQFTPKQVLLMQADLNSSGRNYLDNTYTPAAETLAAPADMCISPVGGATADYSDQFTFKWNAVANATFYFLEVGLTTNITNTGIYSQLVKGATEATIKYAATPGKTLYWRVTPMNEYAHCVGSNASASQKFITGATSGTVSIEGLGEWAVSPNPASGTSEISVFTEADNGFEADIEISSISGQRVFFEKGHPFAPGESSYVLPTGGVLAAGSYLVSLVQPTGRLTKKLVVF